jgi:hypothetical protein
LGSAAGPTSIARKLFPRLQDAYKRAYYAGIISERRAKARLDNGGPGASGIAYRALHAGSGLLRKGRGHRPPGDDAALLRYNTCVRLLERYPKLQPVPEEHPAPNLDE